MMGENPNNNNWWNMINSSSPSSLIPSQYVLGSSSSIPFTEIPEPSHSWSQLLFTGLPGEEERLGFSHFQSKKLEDNNNNINNWDNDQNTLIINNNNNPSSSPTRVLHNNNIVDVIKHEVSQTGNFYGRHSHEEFQASSSSWSHNNHHNIMVVPVSSSSPIRSSSVTSLSSINNNLLDFSYNNSNNNNKVSDHNRNDQVQYGSSQCNNSTTTIGVCNKKAKGQPSPSQPPLKVRKEKLGDRITALHQLVSPFGKTDTASVLLEAIGYIRLLQSQIEALSSPYLKNGSKNNNMRNQNYVHGERNSVFPEDPGQLFNDIGLKRKVAPSQDAKDNTNELKSRGLCLVPVSFTEHIGNGNSSDYWAPAYATGL